MPAVCPLWALLASCLASCLFPPSWALSYLVFSGCGHYQLAPSPAVYQSNESLDCPLLVGQPDRHFFFWCTLCLCALSFLSRFLVFPPICSFLCIFISPRCREYEGLLLFSVLVFLCFDWLYFIAYSFAFPLSPGPAWYDLLPFACWRRQPTCTSLDILTHATLLNCIRLLEALFSTADIFYYDLERPLHRLLHPPGTIQDIFVPLLSNVHLAFSTLAIPTTASKDPYSFQRTGRRDIYTTLP